MSSMVAFKANTSKITRIHNMLRSSQPLYCTVAKMRMQVSALQFDTLFLIVANGTVRVDIGQARLFSYVR